MFPGMERLQLAQPAESASARSSSSAFGGDSFGLDDTAVILPHPDTAGGVVHPSYYDQSIVTGDLIMTSHHDAVVMDHSGATDLNGSDYAWMKDKKVIRKNNHTRK